MCVYVSCFVNAVQDIIIITCIDFIFKIIISIIIIFKRNLIYKNKILKIIFYFIYIYIYIYIYSHIWKITNKNTKSSKIYIKIIPVFYF